VADTITQSGGSLTTYFTEGDMVRVLGSTSNDDEYLIVTAADAALTLLAGCAGGHRGGRQHRCRLVTSAPAAA
jgi:hypothetical protein